MSNTQVRHIENFWKQKTVDSNALFNQNKFLEALHGYTEAHVVAETLNVNYLDALKAEIPLLQVFVISCKNWADWKRLKNTCKELYIFCCIVQGIEIWMPLRFNLNCVVQYLPIPNLLRNIKLTGATTKRP